MRLFPLLVIAFTSLCASIPSTQGFEVNGKAVSTTFCAAGKCETDSCEDEVLYEVDLNRSKVTRKAILVQSKKPQAKGLGGLQADNTVYEIIYADSTLIGGSKNKRNTQTVIKAIGRCGSVDGFETIVIGEDFIHTSRSSADYFVLYYYNRISK